MTLSQPCSGRMLRVGLDLDGVCYDFVDSLRTYLVTRRGYDRTTLPDATRWEFFLDWGLTLQQFLDACHAGVDAGIIFRHGNPFAGVLAACRKIAAAGHEIHIVTDRSQGTGTSAVDATRWWLAHHGLVHHTLTISRDKTTVPADLFIEDRVENYLALRAAGVDAYLLTRPWNAQLTDAHRVENLEEFAEVVIARAADAA